MAPSSPHYEQMSEELLETIKGVNRYNPNNVELLEQCIHAMIAEVKYDKDILLTTLKLYQLNPQKHNESMVCLILLKTMMVLPRSDYALAKYLIDPGRSTATEVRRVMDVGALLESCNFALFWRVLRGEAISEEDVPEKYKTIGDVKRLIDPIIGFEDAVRVYACHVINITFQRIDKAQLMRLLGGVSDSVLASYAKHNGWTYEPGIDATSGGCYLVQNHEATIKTRSIEEKLTFEECAEVIKHA